MRKQLVIDRVLGALLPLDGLRSVTFVGSFVDRSDLSGISDVDTVVVVDELTPSRFNEAFGAVAALTAADVGFPDHRLFVNSTLGPLKFDAGGQVVIHLMLYDLASHREHVLKSPFTCLDWERSPYHWGTSLRDLYPAGRLQPRDFLSSRRGLLNYIDDLESGRLSFRRFEARDGRMVEVPDSRPLDRRHAGEYAYHIVRNLIANALKMRTGCNQLWDEAALENDWERELPDLAPWLPFYRSLRQTKFARRDDFRADALKATRGFLEAFASAIERDIAEAFTLRLMRHAPTSMNDGTFLGSRRDPPLFQSPHALGEAWDAVYSSPLKRAVDTAAALAPAAPLQIDPRLIEIDYGLVEGLTPSSARDRFPSLREAWDAGIDIVFPQGEHTSDVVARARAFLDSLPAGKGRALAVTHNVVIRAILADLLGLDLHRAWRIPVAHLEAIDICRISGRWVPNLEPEIKARILDGYTG